MTKQHWRFSRTLRCEPLEPRRLLAGDVTAKVNRDGHLIITGDAQSNAIQIEAGLLPGQYVITGLPDGDSVPTTINHQGTVTVSGVTGDVRVSMNAGNDSVTIGSSSNVVVAGNLNISTDVGDDSVSISNTTVGASINVTTGDGADTITATHSSAAVDVNVHSGDGGAELSPGHLLGDTVFLENLDAGGNMNVRSGNGVDIVHVSFGASGPLAVGVGGTLTIASNGDVDDLAVAGGVVAAPTPENPSNVVSDGSIAVVGDIVIQGGAGADDGGQSLQLDYVNSLGSVDVRAGAGASNIITVFNSNIQGSVNMVGNGTLNQLALDTSEVQGNLTQTSRGSGDQDGLVLSTVHGNVVIKTGVDDQSVFVLQSHIIGTTTIQMNAGNDYALFQDSVFDGAVSVMFGQGDDTLELSNSIFGSSVQFDGGKGNDTLLDDGGNTFDQTPTITHFES